MIGFFLFFCVFTKQVFLASFYVTFILTSMLSSILWKLIISSLRTFVSCLSISRPIVYFLCFSSFYIPLFVTITFFFISSCSFLVFSVKLVNFIWYLFGIPFLFFYLDFRKYTDKLKSLNEMTPKLN